MQTSSTVERSERVERAEHRFYTGMAVVILLLVVAGFTQSFFLRPLFPDHSAPTGWVLSIHGAVFTLWILLFLTQATLINRGRVALHRRIGRVGAALAVVMISLGTFVALRAASEPGGFADAPFPQKQMLLLSLGDLTLFTVCVALAIHLRARPELHKRFMLLGTINVAMPALSRLAFGVSDGMGIDLGPLPLLALLFAVLAAIAVWDWRSRGRVHRVTLIVGVVTFVSLPMRIAVSGTGAWLTVAEWITW